MPNPAGRLKPALVSAATLLLLLAPALALAAPAGTVVGLSGASVVESGGARGAVRLVQAQLGQEPLGGLGLRQGEAAGRRADGLERIEPRAVVRPEVQPLGNGRCVERSHGVR